jgi:hypothetical protein
MKSPLSVKNGGKKSAARKIRQIRMELRKLRKTKSFDANAKKEQEN